MLDLSTSEQLVWSGGRARGDLPEIFGGCILVNPGNSLFPSLMVLNILLFCSSEDVPFKFCFSYI